MKAGKTLQHLILLVTTPSLMQCWAPPLPLRSVPVGLEGSKTKHESLHDDPNPKPAELSRQQFGQVMLLGALAILPGVQEAAAITIALPEEGEIEDSIPADWTGVDNPFEGARKQFGRLDSTNDFIFYADPRFVEHVDAQAVKSMTTYISQEAIRGNNVVVLDLCSSWTSHIDLAMCDKKPQRISGLGMNAKELERNAVLDDWLVRDLNENPTLPYEDASFDVVLCQLSIDYLTRPKEVLKEVSRVLRPGGSVHILFSNRLFLSKAVALWTGADDIDHAYTVGCYLHFSDGGYKNIQAKDLSTRKGRDKRIAGDPLYVVTASKL